MRLNPLKYVGESIPCQGHALLGDAESAWDAAAASAQVVRSSIISRRLADPALDLAAIEREARAAQSAWIASSLKSFLAAVARKLFRRGDATNDERQAVTPSADGSITAGDKASLPRPVAHAFQGVEMKATTNNAVDWSRINKRLESIRMNEYDRRHAIESLRNAERIVDLLTPLGHAVGTVAHGVEDAVLGTAHGIKAIFAKPVKH